MALTAGAALPALSVTPLQVAVNVPTPLGVPPVNCRLVVVATPEPPRLSVVLQSAAGTLPRVQAAPWSPP